MSDPIELLRACHLCPRECGIDRFCKTGFCGEGRTVRIARAELHMWEEPCISGKNGSGTVFFSGCNLKCCFCQNFEISHLGKGFLLSDEELAETFLRMQEMGAHNINLVTPTHFVPQILNALEMTDGKLNIPVVYNCGGYENPETLELLKEWVDIFIPDLKYFDDEAAAKYSSCEGYFDKAIKAIRKMADIAGKPCFENGLMKGGVIVRHLILPNHRHDSIRLIEELKKNFSPDELLISLMCQYTPVYKSSMHKEINRKLSAFEYKSVLKVLEKSGFDGFTQQRDSASTDYIPEFYSEKYF
ncbi:MAG: radical SAM protein [Oscillospiraceae bacterium]